MINPLRSQQGNTIEIDVLVIGSGISGMHFCQQVIALQPKLSIALISKGALNEGSSKWAQGGIAAVNAIGDSQESHINDTLRAGDGLCHQPAVEFIIRQAPEAINALEGYDIKFCRQHDGDYVLAKEGGHTHRRVFNCGDQTGHMIIDALCAITRQQQQIHIYENHIAVNLIGQYHPHRTDIQGEISGAYVLDTNTGLIHTFMARCTILATGGAGKTYRYTSNPMVATGDGVAMAYRAGARVGNMEFYQFHPTLLHHPQVNNFLISEAVRGEGARLICPETGNQFMKIYNSEAMELATRDIVSKAIFCEIEANQHDFVFLDISHQSKQFLQNRFPQIYQTLYDIGIDMAKDPIPVVPAAHYQCGGILTDIDGRTDLNRLFAIGETAFTGLHGANRLASNSLLEGVIMARNAAFACFNDITTPLKEIDNIPSWNSPTTVNTRRASQINAHWRGLRGEMTSYAGIVRTEAGLADILQLIMKRKKIIEEYYWNHNITRDFIELRNIVLNAELIVRSALWRQESRGGHYREDYPNKLTVAQESIIRRQAPRAPYKD